MWVVMANVRALKGKGVITFWGIFIRFEGCFTFSFALMQKKQKIKPAQHNPENYRVIPTKETSLLAFLVLCLDANRSMRFSEHQ